MKVEFHPHSRERMAERGVIESEVTATIQSGERFPTRFGRTGFRHNFPFGSEWHGNHYEFKEVEVYAVERGGGWLVITVIVRYF